VSEPDQRFLSSSLRVSLPAAKRVDWTLPQTSAQEIGWFAKRETDAAGFRSSPAAADALRRPLVHSELSQYMADFWKVYPSNANLLRGASNPAAGQKPKQN